MQKNSTVNTLKKQSVETYLEIYNFEQKIVLFFTAVILRHSLLKKKKSLNNINTDLFITNATEMKYCFLTISWHMKLTKSLSYTLCSCIYAFCIITYQKKKSLCQLKICSDKHSCKNVVNRDLEFRSSGIVHISFQLPFHMT